MQFLPEALSTKRNLSEMIIGLLDSKENLDGALKRHFTTFKDLTLFEAFTWLIDNNIAIIIDEAHNVFNLEGSKWTTTVSYTHLTLPTICSV